MIVACDECSTRYELSDDKVPERGIRVRCPKCRFVWRLTREAAKDNQFEVSRSQFDSGFDVSEVQGSQWEAQNDTAVAEEPMSVDGESAFAEIDIDGAAKAAEAVVDRESPEIKKKKERAKRLARVFVSDILEYNKEKRDKALADGNLMAALGPEIKKGWEGYKERVGSELKESSGYFKEALNSILADGQKIF